MIKYLLIKLIQNRPMFVLFHFIGPVMGMAGHWSGLSWVFWIGVALCGLILWLDGASEVVRAPVLQTFFMAVGSATVDPWYVGAGLGLVGWTAVDSLGLLVPSPILCLGAGILTIMLFITI